MSLILFLLVLLGCCIVYLLIKIKKIDTNLEHCIDKIKSSIDDTHKLENYITDLKSCINNIEISIKEVKEGIKYIEKELRGNDSKERIDAIEKSITKFDKFEEQINIFINKLDTVKKAEIDILETFQSVTCLFLLPVKQVLAKVANSIPITRDDIECLNYIFPIIKDSSDKLNINDDNLIFMRELLDLASKELNNENTVIKIDFNQIPNFDSKLDELRRCLGVFEMPCSNKIGEVIHTLEK